MAINLSKHEREIAQRSVEILTKIEYVATILKYLANHNYGVYQEIVACVENENAALSPKAIEELASFSRVMPDCDLNNLVWLGRVIALASNVTVAV